MFCFYRLRTLSLTLSTTTSYAKLALILYSDFQLKPFEVKLENALNVEQPGLAGLRKRRLNSR